MLFFFLEGEKYNLANAYDCPCWGERCRDRATVVWNFIEEEGFKNKALKTGKHDHITFFSIFFTADLKKISAENQAYNYYLFIKSLSDHFFFIALPKDCYKS